MLFHLIVGHNLQLNQANTLYMTEHNNQPFNMHLCYNILSREEKWSKIRQEHSVARFLPRKPNEDSSPGNSDAHEDSPFSSSSGGRPAGKFKTKNKKQIDYSPYYEQLSGRMAAATEANKLYAETREAKKLERAQEKQRRHEELQRLRMEELELRNRELARQQEAEEFALLTCNLNELNPIQRRFMEKKLEEYRRRHED